MCQPFSIIAARFALHTTVIPSQHLQNRDLRVTQVISCKETIMLFFTHNNGLTEKILSGYTCLD